MRLKLSTSFTYSALIGVFFLFFSPFPVIATLQAHGEVYKYERRVSMYDFFFSPFQAQRACQSFIAEIFQELLSSIFLVPYLTGVENNYVPPIHDDGKKKKMIGCLQVVCRVLQRTFAALIASCHVPVVGNGFCFYNIYVISVQLNSPHSA